MTFDVRKHLIKVQGNRQYLPVSARLIWFRSEHADWGIETEVVEINFDKQFAVFRARITNADGKVMAVGTKREDVRGFPDWLEKAETGAIGRALALCGYGTQFAPELDETTGARYAESPVPQSRYQPSAELANGHGKTAISETAAECASCGKSITKAQHDLSARNFGESLCPACQKDKGRAQSPPAAAS